MNLLNNDRKLYETIVRMNTYNIAPALASTLKKKYDNVIVHEDYNYIVATGDIPIALVAHMDTVFTQSPSSIFYDPKAEIVWSLQGGVGDDRVGIFLILKMLQQTKLRPYIFFMNDEESGGLGARSLITDYPFCPWDINFFIELDRHGEKDAVFYNCDNKAFTDFICAYNFEKSDGIFSDISVICPAWKIAGVNLSVGYDNEHSVLEIWNVMYGYNTYNKLLQILNDKASHFEYISGPLEYVCQRCGNKTTITELIPVEFTEDDVKWLCIDCITKENVNWCDECGEAFLGTGRICRRCQKYNDRSKYFEFD